MRVFVYKNLHKNLWSLKALDGPDKGRVIAHASYAVLIKCTFKVSQSGRKRVLMEQRKNIHAGIEGELFSVLAANTFYEGLPDDIHDNHAFINADYKTIAYNPYWYDSFMVDDDGVRKITQAMMTVFSPTGVMAQI